MSHSVTQNSAFPLLRLPNEIVVEITLAARPPERELPSPTPELPVEWSLSHVCRQLRQAVTSAATAWTWVEMDLSRRGSIQRAELYFQRSGSCKPRVTLRSPVEADALDAFSPHLQRVSHLIVVYGMTRAFAEIMESIEGVALPNLVHLQIDNRTGEFSSLDLSTIHAPNLVFLRMIGCTQDLPASPLHWARSLTHFELRRYTKDNYDKDKNLALFLGEAKHLHSVTHLYIEWDPDELLDPDGEVIDTDTYKHLRLEYDGTSHDTAVDILIRFCLRNLETLVFHGSHGPQISTLFAWVDPMDWCGPAEEKLDPRLYYPSLTSLVFHNSTALECTDGQGGGYEHIRAPPIARFPSLTSLALVNQCCTAPILLDILGPGSQPWPLLDTVFVWPPDVDTEVVYTALQDIVDWKRSNQQTVPTFRLPAELYDRPYWTANNVQVELVSRPSDAYSANW